MIRFIEVVHDSRLIGTVEENNASPYTLAEVWINENYVVNVREAREYRTLLQEGRLPPDLERSHSFTIVTTNNGQLTETHVVVGSPATVASRLNADTHQLLKG